MKLLTLSLFLVASASYSTALVVYVDSSECVHLQCEWRGEGRNCNPVTIFQHPNQRKNVPGAKPLYPHPIRLYESEKSVLARIQSRYPLNTFTLVDDNGDIGEKCKGRSLWCNVSQCYYPKSIDSFLKSVQERTIQAKLQC